MNELACLISCIMFSIIFTSYIAHYIIFVMLHDTTPKDY